MESVLLLCHSDSSSGATLLDDGRLCLWTEGPSEVDVLDLREETPHEKRHLRLDAYATHPIIEIIGDLSDLESRPMTPEEETMYTIIRNVDLRGLPDRGRLS